MKLKTFSTLFLLACTTGALLSQSVQAFPANDLAKETSPQLVSREEIAAVMQLQSGYDPTATTNVARFQAEVILQLARQARQRRPDGPPLLIRHDLWFQAFLETFGLTHETAPHYSRLAFEHQQDQLVEYRKQRVLRKVEPGPPPEIAVNVKVFWPAADGAPACYSFDDTLSTPHLKVTNGREITYRLLDFGGMIVYDDIRGLSGRPTSGILGLLFKMIGEGQVVSSRIAISDDGWQITRAQVRKGPFEVSATISVQPDGCTEKGLPPGRQDLAALEEHLKKPLRVKYAAMKW
jgi:hypothetical protein